MSWLVCFRSTNFYRFYYATKSTVVVAEGVHFLAKPMLYQAVKLAHYCFGSGQRIRWGARVWTHRHFAYFVAGYWMSLFLKNCFFGQCLLTLNAG